MRDSGMQPRLKLTYPCEWPYVIIGRSEDELRAAVHEIVQNRSHTVNLSHMSAQGRYISLKVLVVVHSDDDRIGIYRALNDHPATKVVI
ncbi:MAG: DUF493 domain-containing protein [Ignavibacteria bacterium]